MTIKVSSERVRTNLIHFHTRYSFHSTFSNPYREVDVEEKANLRRCWIFYVAHSENSSIKEKSWVEREWNEREKNRGYISKKSSWRRIVRVLERDASARSCRLLLSGKHHFSLLELWSVLACHRRSTVKREYVWRLERATTSSLTNTQHQSLQEKKGGEKKADRGKW